LRNFRVLRSVFRNPAAWRRDVLPVVVSLALGMLLYWLGLRSFYSGGAMTHPWLRIVLFVAICAAELFRRRAPVAALIAGFALLAVDIAFGATLPMWVVFTDLLYAATLYGPRRLSRVMLPIAVVALCGTAAASTAFVPVPDWWAVGVVGLAALPFVVVPVTWALNVRQHQEIAEAERTHATQLERIAELDRAAAVAAERGRMARDLHDVVSGHVSAIALQAEAALSLQETDPDTARTALRSVRENSVRALEEMRAMVDVLRADEPDEPVAPARLAELPRLVESARASGLQVAVAVDVDGEAPLPAAVDLTAYRLVQEALTNAMKHAPGAEVSVTARRAPGELALEVVNELSGEPQGDDGWGLLHMRERAASVGGTLTVGPVGSNWVVQAVLPMRGDP